MPPYLRCKFERHQRHWTQAELAQHPEVRKVRPRLYQNDISDIELGRRIPTPEQLEALASAFGIAPASVLMKPVTIADPDDLDPHTGADVEAGAR